MRYLLIALGLWFGLELVFVAVLVAISAREGRRARREIELLERLMGEPGDRLVEPPAVNERRSRPASA